MHLFESLHYHGLGGGKGAFAGAALGIFGLFGLNGGMLPQAVAEERVEVRRELDGLIDQPGLFSKRLEELQQEHGQTLGLHWLSTENDALQSVQKGLSLYGLRVTQVVVREKESSEGEVGTCTFLLYSRGDDGERSKAEFEALLKQSIDTLSEKLGVAPRARGRDPRSAVKAEGVIWEKENLSVLLEYSFTKEVKAAVGGSPFRAEFVRLEVTEKAAPKRLADQFSERPARFVGRDHVKRDATSGDLIIQDIPMVDQGQKGYCVVASAERVFRYYGIRVDANELAQLANSSAEGGTSVNAMIEVLKKLGARFKIRVRHYLDLDYKAFTALLEDYNRMAKREKKDPLPPLSREYGYTEIYERMDAELLKKTRTKSSAGITAFKRHLQTNLEKGVPIFWSCMLGIVPEGDRPQRAGGHMRLIIGLNEKTNEIIYSDSWGRGHEEKRMNLEDAWAITTGIAYVEPI